MNFSHILLLFILLMVDSTKVLCPLFDKIEVLTLGDSPSVFSSLDKM